ncbi:hypothetical protein B0H13DRAFT_1921298 [Mycena leptocephala]|nr:hypothetical protein B0H13DRAFT_1921307 [Mycena leptocephala]KAJ7820364.1 hypothetical protein B0H13DRAFT_1921298 [Mycena leptocephala]
MSDTGMWEFRDQSYLQRKICQVDRQLDSLKIERYLEVPFHTAYSQEGQILTYLDAATQFRGHWGQRATHAESKVAKDFVSASHGSAANAVVSPRSDGMIGLQQIHGHVTNRSHNGSTLAAAPTLRALLSFPPPRPSHAPFHNAWRDSIVLCAQSFVGMQLRLHVVFVGLQIPVRSRPVDPRASPPVNTGQISASYAYVRLQSVLTWVHGFSDGSTGSPKGANREKEIEKEGSREFH